jgi:Flp pilus assembly protein CpaB
VSITIRVDEVQGVANLIQPGDRVNMLILAADGAERYLFQNMYVLFVGTRPAPQPGESTPTTEPGAAGGGGLITVAVRPESALRIAFTTHRDEASVHLTLNPPDYGVNPAPPTVSDNNLFDDAAATEP